MFPGVRSTTGPHLHSHAATARRCDSHGIVRGQRAQQQPRAGQASDVIAVEAEKVGLLSTWVAA